MGYKHLTKEQRYTLMVLLQAQATISRIAEVIGKSRWPGTFAATVAVAIGAIVSIVLAA